MNDRDNARGLPAPVGQPEQVSHGAILGAVMEMRGAFTERLKSIETRLTAGDDRFDELFDEIRDQADRAARERQSLAKRIDHMEKREEIDAQVSEARKQEADAFRKRLYALARYFLPPASAAALAVWLFERFGGG